MAVKRVDKLVEQFARGVAKQTESIKAGDHKASNFHAKKYLAAFRSLSEIGDEGRDALADLLEDERDDVRVMAASFLLRHRHGQARHVLEEAANGEGIVALGAQETLKRWEEGAWSLDPG